MVRPLSSSKVVKLTVASALAMILQAAVGNGADGRMALETVTMPASQTKSGTRNRFWSLGFSGVRHALKAGDGNEFLGNALDVSFGTGYLHEKWFSYGAINLLLGPYETTRDRQLDVDYSGTGFTYWWGLSAQELNLRSSAGGYGFAMGIDYSDTSGSSIGRNRKEVGDPKSPDNVGLINNYSMRLSALSMVPGIFFSWLETGRPRGNKPELLKTRIEGYFLTLGAQIPLISTYRTHYTKLTRDDSAGRGDFINSDIKETGKMEGFSILVNFVGLLGI